MLQSIYSQQITFARFNRNETRLHSHELNIAIESITNLLFYFKTETAIIRIVLIEHMWGIFYNRIWLISENWIAFELSNVIFWFRSSMKSNAQIYDAFIHEQWDEKKKNTKSNFVIEKKIIMCERNGWFGSAKHKNLQ